MLTSGAGILVSGCLLRVRTAEHTYQFGLNRGRFWEGDLPFPVRREAASASQVWTYRVLRAALILAIAYTIWGKSR